MISDLGYFIFIIEDQRFAMPLDSVGRIIRAQAVTRVTDPPPFIIGLIDYFGEVIPVINLRKRLGFMEKAITSSDRFIIVNTASLKLALVIDEVEGIIRPAEHDLIESKTIDKGLRFIKILRHDDGIILIYNLEELLRSIEEINIANLIENQETEDISEI